MRSRSWIKLIAAAGLVAPWVAAAARHRTAQRERRRRESHDVDAPALHCEDLLTYQALLDESLSLTFPASDPICTTAALHCGRPCDTPANPSDWHLDPGSKIAGHPAS